MTVLVNPPPILRIPDRFFNDPEIREFFEQQKHILFQLWNRTGGNVDLIANLEQVPVINITNSDLIMTSDQLGSLVTVIASTADVDITFPEITADDIGKSVMIVILDATFDTYALSSGANGVLGDTSVLMNEQYLAVHYTSISLTDWIAR